MRNDFASFDIRQSLLNLLPDEESILNFFQGRIVRKLLQDFLNDLFDCEHVDFLATIGTKSKLRNHHSGV